MQLRTINNYDFFECSSAMQKAIRRADAAVAGYFALELCRDADHLQNFVYDQKLVNADEWLEDARKNPIDIPEYTYDVHTRKGKKMGRTKEQFFRDEYDALTPRAKGLFDDLL